MKKLSAKEFLDVVNSCKKQLFEVEEEDGALTFDEWVDHLNDNLYIEAGDKDLLDEEDDFDDDDDDCSF